MRTEVLGTDSIKSAPICRFKHVLWFPTMCCALRNIHVYRLREEIEIARHRIILINKLLLYKAYYACLQLTLWKNMYMYMYMHAPKAYLSTYSLWLPSTGVNRPFKNKITTTEYPIQNSTNLTSYN